MRPDDIPGGELVDRIPVPFAGEGAGEAELTFGQLGLWQSMRPDLSRTVDYVAEPPPGTTVDDVVDMLAFMVGRHQSLRTTLVPRQDGRPPRQKVASAGEIPLLVVSAAGEDPAEVAEALSTHWQLVPFAYETEWPVRLGVVVAAGVVTHVVTVILHTSIDAFGFSALVADIGARDPSTGAPAGPVTGLPPLAQAAWETTPAGRKQNERSLRYLEKVLRTAPADLLGPPRYPGEPHYELVRYRSRALRLAIHAVAARERIDDSPALLTAFLVGAARVTGAHPMLTLMLVSNRFRPGYASSVSALIKVTPFLLDLAGRTVGEAVVRAAGRALNAYKNAYYNAYEQDEVIERVESERGERFDLSCYYNDRRQGDRVHAGVPAPSAEEIRAALADSELSWRPEVGIPRTKIHLCVDDPPGAVELVLSADTRYLSRDDMAALARAVEEAAVQAALEPDTPTGISADVPVEAVR
jgi:hypothetical protein